MFLALVFLMAAQIVVSSGAVTPDVKNFNPILSKELEFRIDDYKTAFVGRVVDYQNPDDPNEFVRVYYRQAALVSERARENNTAEAGGVKRSLFILNYHRKQETEALGRVQQAVDAFAYVQWRTVRDPRSGQDIQTGSVQTWLLDPSGTYAYHSQRAGTESSLKSSPFSEPSKPSLVGIKFTLGDTTHIVRIDQDDISTPVKEVTNEKK